MPHQRDRRKQRPRQDATVTTPVNTAAQPQEPVRAEVVRYKITATDGKLGRLHRILDGLIVPAGRKSALTGNKISIAATESFYDVLDELKKLGTFQDNIPTQPRRT
jgi:hypothetical protein